MKYVKYHGLGNDYLVMRPQDLERDLDVGQIQRICNRNFGIGSDGILLGPLESKICNFGLRIFNPDGSEAEKSGNGLRIFSRYLRDAGETDADSFTLETLGGAVKCRVGQGGRNVTVEMGKVSFLSTTIPVAGEEREVLKENIRIGGTTFVFCAATIGNPHCVVLCDDISPAMARQYGPLLETDPRFPRRTNVQFLKVMDRENIGIEIWERGAGYTLASGSSSVAAAAVACRLGLCNRDITVHMPGGELDIALTDDFFATLSGPVTRVCEGNIDSEIFTEG